MKPIEQEKRGIKRIIRMQFISLALIITAGGIIYGINTGKWSSAFGTTITFLALISPFVPLTYMAGLNRLEKYSDRQSEKPASVCFCQAGRSIENMSVSRQTAV